MNGKHHRFSAEGLTLRDTWAPLMLITFGVVVVLLAIAKNL